VSDYNAVTAKIEGIIGNYKKSIVPIASKLAIISSGERQEGISIIGISPDSELDRLTQNIVEGKLDLGDENDNFIVIGKVLANKLMINVGSRITVFSLKDDQIPSPDNLPNIERFTVTGIFESGMAEYDDLYAYTNLSDAQNLFSIGNSIN